MQDRHAISYKHWSLKVGRADPQSRLVSPYMGEIVAGVDDLHQSIANIILTEKGSVPTEPEKGCDVMPFVDRHPSVGIPNLTRNIWDALDIWEPRIEVDNVAVREVAHCHFATEVFWRPIESVLDDLLSTKVNFGSNEGVFFGGFVS